MISLLLKLVVILVYLLAMPVAFVMIVARGLGEIWADKSLESTETTEGLSDD